MLVNASIDPLHKQRCEKIIELLDAVGTTSLGRVLASLWPGLSYATAMRAFSRLQACVTIRCGISLWRDGHGRSSVVSFGGVPPRRVFHVSYAYFGGNGWATLSWNEETCPAALNAWVQAIKDNSAVNGQPLDGVVLLAFHELESDRGDVKSFFSYPTPANDKARED